ncbi:4-hydroxybenzoyl-CoA reductase [Hydrogenophaga sp. Root209]|uniref:CoxG family protein n=1 Tax=unclassified Hydrogenophaga TaxID=2610897 RepID=UPI000700BA8B|nr:SRPBCC family protein [Hydrogenophaga sp. Root209]KRB99903.1 4-hydroxybenzoyl-CoA reductase [Hydrogenophaga sp. Root209]
MEIEKTLSLDAPPARVWALLLDPNAMGACVPGMESIEVVSDDEYVAVMKVKMAFISARFKLKTRIVERDEPRYLHAEGTGEDASVASSLKQNSEMWLGEREGGGTTLRMKVRVDVLGRMGTFGLGVMKTKADRMWDEFGVNAAARLAGAAAPQTPAPALPDAAPEGRSEGAPEMVQAAAKVEPPAAAPLPAMARTVAAVGFWARLFGRTPAGGQDIRVELRRGDTTLTVHWPVLASQDCAAWLRTLV